MQQSQLIRDLRGIIKFTVSMTIALMLGISFYIICSFFMGIPKQYALEVPPDLICNSFTVSRKGWQCSSTASFLTSPLTLGAAVFLLSIVFIRIPINYARVRVIVALLVILGALICFTVGVYNVVYFLQGKIDEIYAAISLILFLEGGVVVYFLKSKL
jgi:hypothetical protein